MDSLKKKKLKIIQSKYKKTKIKGGGAKNGWDQAGKKKPR